MTTAPSRPTASPDLAVPHVPILRWGETYESLDTVELTDHRTGAAVARVGQANAGLVRRDLWRADESARALRAFSVAELLEMCATAGGHFMNADLPLGAAGEMQSPQDYVEALSATSGLPHAMCRGNMRKVYTVFTEMGTILRGLTRGLDLAVIDTGFGEHDGMPLSFATAGDALGVVLPSNSPGVNSIWMPSIPLKTPVVIKPGREEPWTPWRIMQAFIAAGVPRAAFGFYPTDHEGAATIIECCPRAQVFGNEKTTAKYRGNPGVEIHGPGRSKIVIGPDVIDQWRDHLDVVIASVVDNGGRSCINASAILVPRHGAAIADALARAVAPIDPRPADADDARLSAHANPTMASFIDAAIDDAVGQGGAEEVTARYRTGPRLVEDGGATYLRPTIIRCDDMSHGLANTEFMFPFTSVTEVATDDVFGAMGPTLVVTAITRDPDLVRALSASPHVDRLNIGPVPTTRVDWDQPHEGNLFEFLYTRRAIHREAGWTT